MNIAIRLDDLSSSESQSIVREHMAGMLANTPIESVHALPLDKLKQPNITFWTDQSTSDIVTYRCTTTDHVNTERGCSMIQAISSKAMSTVYNRRNGRR